MKNVKNGVLWLAVALIGAGAFAMLALNRGEHVNAVWLVIAAVACYSIAYRFYSLFIARNIFELDDRRMTPAERLSDGLDYVPTNKWVLFGHHFAAIAGAGPLVGPILAAQMGFLPGTIWILVGVMLAGAVQDFLVLFISTRRDGRSLGEMARQELVGPHPRILRGGRGSDSVFDDQGNDKLVGGRGNDRFSSVDGNSDRIRCGAWD